MAVEFFPAYPDPMPRFQYLGGEYGKGLLEFALAQPQQTFDGRYLYRTIFDKAAILFYSMTKDHAFLDGNKRMALATTAIFLVLNDYFFSVPTDEGIRFCVFVASSDRSDQLYIVREITSWLRRNSQKHQLDLNLSMN